MPSPMSSMRHDPAQLEASVGDLATQVGHGDGAERHAGDQRRPVGLVTLHGGSPLRFLSVPLAVEASVGALAWFGSVRRRWRSGLRGAVGTTVDCVWHEVTVDDRRGRRRPADRGRSRRRPPVPAGGDQHDCAVDLIAPHVVAVDDGTSPAPRAPVRHDLDVRRARRRCRTPMPTIDGHAAPCSPTRSRPVRSIVCSPMPRWYAAGSSLTASGSYEAAADAAAQRDVDRRRQSPTRWQAPRRTR